MLSYLCDTLGFKKDEPKRLIDYIKMKNITHIWDFSSNPNISLRDIESNPQIKWNWNEMTHNPNITMDFVIKHKDKKFNWYYLGLNKNIKVSELIDNNLHIDREFFALNQSLTMDEFIDYSHLFGYYLNYNFSDNLRLQDLMKLPIVWSDATCMRLNDLKEIDNLIDVILDNQDKKNNFSCRYSNNLNMKEYLFLNHNCQSFDRYGNVTIKDYLNNRNKRIWDNSFFKNENVSVEDLIKNNLECKIIYHPNIISYMDKKFNLEIENDFISNPNVTIDDIKKRYPKMFFITNLPNVTLKILSEIDFNVCYEDLLLTHHPYFKSKPHKKKLVIQFMKCDKLIFTKCCHPCRDILIAEYKN